MEKYMALHAEMIVDRGCEGTLVNYETIPPRFARRIRVDFVGGTEQGD
jgi:hypothetical protein